MSLPYTCRGACKSGDPAVHHHIAPSRLEYDVRVPSMLQWIRYGMVPESLNVIARKAEFEDYKPSELANEEIAQLDDLQDWTVAQMLEPKATVEQVRGLVKLKASDVWVPAKDAMPKEDRDDLWQVARRVIVPRTELLAQLQWGPVGEMTPFRDGPNGALVPSDVSSAGSGPGEGGGD